eukprot:gb/GECG01005335.1/.p1 GENE.gb/GECG01005335.1/~~gb/GECG01005335.1/.p1  ORF type:complete len:307 (+),score=10.04 gb/GECG01005335.1/:1-921(+)
MGIPMICSLSYRKLRSTGVSRVYSPEIWVFWSLSVLWYISCTGVCVCAARREFVLGRDGYADLRDSHTPWWNGYRIRVNHTIAVAGMYASSDDSRGISVGLFNLSQSTMRIEQVLAWGSVSSQGRNQRVKFGAPIFLVPGGIYAIAQGGEESFAGSKLIHTVDVERLLGAHQALATWEPSNGCAFWIPQLLASPSRLLGNLVKNEVCNRIPDIGLFYTECPSSTKKFKTDGSRCICVSPSEMHGCQFCGSGYIPDNDSQACTKCAGNLISKMQAATCKTCPGDKMPDSEQGRCICRNVYEFCFFRK